MTKSHYPSGVVDQAKTLLNDNQPEEALKILNRSRDVARPIQTLRSVCLMRTGQIEDALRILESLAFPRGGVCIDPDAPLQLKVNYATAQVLSGNLAGCLATLDEIHEQHHPAVERLREAIAAWRKSQGVWRRLALAVGLLPYDVRVSLDFPPGEL